MRRLWLRFTNLLRPGRAEDELTREIGAHLSVMEEDFQRRGLAPEEARLAARRAFGGVEQAKELHRDERSFGWLSDVQSDIRYALRALRKNPSFTAVAVLTLALGIGANTAMFSVLYAVVLRPLPFPSPEQLVMLWTEQPGQGVREGRSAYAQVEEWRANSKSLADLAVFDPVSTTLTGPGDWEQISVVRASPSFFTILVLQPIRGRLFSREEAENRHRVVLLGQQFWQTRFGGAGDAIGKLIEIDGLPSEVVGILPSNFRMGEDVDVWEPHTMFPDWEARRSARGGGSWFVLGRIRPDVTLQQAQTELSAVAHRLENGRSAAGQEGGVSVTPLSLHVVGPTVRLALWMLTGAVFCVLLIGVANITSLSLARSAGREREIAIRSALGASRGRVLRQLLTESVTLAVLAGLAGFVFAVLATPLIVALRPGETRPLDSVWLDLPILAWALGLSVVTGLLVGLAPAITVRQGNLRPALHEGTRGTSSGVTTRLTRRALVVVEFALAIVLLVGAGLLTRSLLRVQSVDPGFSTERVLLMAVSLPPLSSTVQRVDFYNQMLEQIASVGAVEKAGIIGDLFIGGNAEQVVTAEGGTRAFERIRFRRDEVSGGFFETLRIPLVRGRAFSAEDGPNAPRVAIVNITMAGRLWPGLDDPLGKRFKLGAPEADGQWFTVVGLVGDMRRQNLETEPIAQMFEPVTQNPSRIATVLVRTTGDPLNMVGTLRAAIRRVDTRGFIYGSATLGSRLRQSHAERRFQTSLLIAFSLVALLLAAIGIYGVVQYSIATRTREIGIRMAVGAQRSDIFKLVVGEGMKLSLTGLVLGLGGAVWLGHLGSSLLFGVAPTDLPTYVVVSAVLTAVAIAGCYFPARRAARVDPLVALRCE